VNALFMTTAVLVGSLWLGGAYAALSEITLIPSTPEEHLAELGIALTFLDRASPSGDQQTLCQSLVPSMMMSGKADPQLCARYLDRVNVWRRTHAQLCRDLKITGGTYGCPQP
jgi:hypothetical protein